MFTWSIVAHIMQCVLKIQVSETSADDRMVVENPEILSYSRLWGLQGLGLRIYTASGRLFGHCELIQA
jgi:hypothetical protein